MSPKWSVGCSMEWIRVRVSIRVCVFDDGRGRSLETIVR